MDGLDVPLNFDQITERIFVGSRPRTPADWKRLEFAAINCVLNVCETADPPDSPPGWTYMWNPAADDGQPKPALWFQRSIKWALAQLSTPGDRIYVHCVDGVNRGPSTVYAILRAFGLSKLDAALQVHASRIVTAVGLRYAADADAAILHGW